MNNRIFRNHRFILITALSLLIGSCSSLPKIVPVDQNQQLSIEETCRTPFVKKNVQLVHSLEASVPGDRKSYFVGITTVYPSERAFESVLLTIEGLVVFQARFDVKGISIKRAVHPFDSKGFAQGLLNDIELIFLKPDGKLVQLGTYSGKGIGCRYLKNKRKVIDIIVLPNKNWEIHSYKNSNYRPIKTVLAQFETSNSNDQTDQKDTYPTEMQLLTHGIFGYSLQMKLIQVDHPQ